MNKKEKLVLFKTLKDLRAANHNRLPTILTGFSELDEVIKDLEGKK